MTRRPPRSGPLPSPRVEPSPSDPLVLGIDTSAPVEGIALVRGSLLLGRHCIRRPKGRGTGMANLISSLLASAGEPAAALAAVAVGHGPGAFSSLRSGLALADGFATALGIPVWSRSSADAWLAPFAETAGPLVLCLDSRRGEVFSRVEEGGRVRLEEALRTPAALIAWLLAEADRRFIFVGEGAELHAPLFRAGLGERFVLSPRACEGPSAVWIARDVAAAITRGESPTGRPEPRYLRPPAEARPRSSG